MARQDIGRRFVMRQKWVSFGDDYFVKNEAGDKVCEVDGKAMRIRNTLFIKDHDGNERYKVQEKKVRIRDTMFIYKDGDVVAKVHKALVSPLRDRFAIDVPGGDDMSATGSILDHDYTIKRGRQVVATVSKSWLRIRDSYGVEVESEDDPYLVLAIAVCLDAMCHPEE